MPTYNVTDPTTGKSVKLTGDSPPTESELKHIFSRLHGSAQATTPRKELEGEIGKMSSTQKSLTALGSGLWHTGKGIQQAFYDITGQKDKSKGVAQDVAEADQQMNVLKGTAGAKGVRNPYSRMEAYGEVLPALAVPGGAGKGIFRNMLSGAAAGGVIGGTQVIPEGGSRTRNALVGAATGGVLPAVAPLLSKAATGLARPVLGRLTGAGSGAIEEAFKSGANTVNPFKSETSFAKSMRGKTDAQDLVNSANDALRAIKDKRAVAYQEKLAEVSKNKEEIDTGPVEKKIMELIKRYGIKILPQGKLDLSRIAMGKTGRRDVADVLKTLSTWGTKEGDRTAIGLDTLKRQLDDFYSDSSQARQFVASIRDTVRGTIDHAIPEYGEMTKGYAEATKMIKDIESGLMLRKQGMTGRVVADQTLRRLMSSMKDNFTLRKELVDTLGAEGAKDIGGQIAGYTMRSPIPHGIAGSGPAIIGEVALAKLVSPKFWPMLAASSPRLVGEFLHALGYSKKLADNIAKAIPPAIKKSGKEGMQRLIAQQTTKQEIPSSSPDQWKEIGTEWPEPRADGGPVVPGQQ